MSTLIRLGEALTTAGVNHTGLAILQPEQTEEQGWFVITVSTGQRIRIDDVPVGDRVAATAVVLGFDFSQPAQVLWEAQQRASIIGSATAVRQGINLPNATINLIDVPDLALPLAANKRYLFEFSGSFITVAGATGIGLAVNGPPGVTLLRVNVCIAESVQASRNGVLTAYNQVLLGQTSLGPTPLPFWLDGNIDTGPTGGLLLLRFRTEISGNAATILAGSLGLLYPVG